jgi:hypothetical protein
MVIKTLFPMRVFNFFIIPSALIFFLSACSSLPIQEMSDARQAVEAAKAGYAHDAEDVDLQRAINMLRNAESEWAVGEYESAHDSAEKAKEHALRAQQKRQH